MTTTPEVVRRARELTRQFFDAFNARDVAALRPLIAAGAELRWLDGAPQRGEDGLRALVRAAQEDDVRLVPYRTAEVDERGEALVVAVRVRELVGPDDIERVAEFEVRDGRIAAFALRALA